MKQDEDKFSEKKSNWTQAQAASSTIVLLSFVFTKKEHLPMLVSPPNSVGILPLRLFSNKKSFSATMGMGRWWQQSAAIKTKQQYEDEIGQEKCKTIQIQQARAQAWALGQIGTLTKACQCTYFRRNTSNKRVPKQQKILFVNRYASGCRKKAMKIKAKQDKDEIGWGQKEWDINRTTQ